jgi:hypothetical protein
MVDKVSWALNKIYAYQTRSGLYRLQGGDFVTKAGLLQTARYNETVIFIEVNYAKQSSATKDDSKRAAIQKGET